MERYVFRGDIYEIYDCVNSTPSLGFLREAEAFAAKVFSGKYETDVPGSLPTHALYAFLAYLETLEKYGYANGAPCDRGPYVCQERVYSYPGAQNDSTRISINSRISFPVKASCIGNWHRRMLIVF